MIVYGRCFTKANGRGLKLEDNRIKAEYKTIHRDVMTLRHEYIAHAGVSDAERIYLTMNFKILANNKCVQSVGYEAFKQIGLSPEQLVVFSLLIDDLSTWLKNQGELEIKKYLSSLSESEKTALLSEAMAKSDAKSS